MTSDEIDLLETLPTKEPTNVVAAMGYAGRICPCCIAARRAFSNPKTKRAKRHTLRTHRKGR